MQLITRGSRRREASRVLENLKAVVLLGGSVRGRDFGAAIGRSLLDLPVEAGRTLLEYWHEAAASLAGFLSTAGLPVRVIVDGRSAAPSVTMARGQAVLSVERDPRDYRGTAGVIKDISVAYAPDDYLLVANAAQLALEPLPALVDEMASFGGDVALVSHTDGTPSGFMLIRCGALSTVSTSGFIDLKEQALPQIAAQHRVEVLERDQPTGMPVRTVSDYLTALRWYHTGRLAGDQALADWRPAFTIVEEASEIDPRARVHDSVVLRGGRIAKDAVVVRSVVAPGASVARGQMAVDELVGPGRARGR